MEATDLYLKALQRYLDKGEATQAGLARDLGVTPQHLNGFIKGRRNFSEERKEELARLLGTTYIDMLFLGREIAEGETASFQPVERKSGKVASLTHDEIISQFEDKETARKLNQMLVTIEKADPNRYKKIEGFITALYETLEVKKIVND